MLLSSASLVDMSPSAVKNCGRTDLASAQRERPGALADAEEMTFAARRCRPKRSARSSGDAPAS
jgi:hypothetical protein